MRVDCAAYVDGHRRSFDLDNDSVDDLGDGFVWLGLRMPDTAELDQACSMLGLVGVDPEEILTPHTRPVLVVEDGTAQLVLRTAAYQDQVELIELGEMTLLADDHAVITIRHGEASPLSGVRAELESEPERLRVGAAAVVAAVIARVIDDYGPALDGFENDVIEVEGDVFSEGRGQPVQRLYQLKREVRRLTVAIDALQDPLARLIRLRDRNIDHEVRDDLIEAGDQLDRAVTRANSLSELVDAALAASQTQVSVQQNDDMRKISAWVAIAAVPTMLAGIYGMNFDHMPELDNQYGYPIALGVMVLAIGVLYRQFRKSGWL